MRYLRSLVVLILVLSVTSPLYAKGKKAKSVEVSIVGENPPEKPAATVPATPTIPVIVDYQIGPGDVLDVNVLQPEELINTVTVSPDGTITFPYIGTVAVKGQTLAQVQETIQKLLGDGYMKYPVVSVSLKESHSRRFFVYGEVSKPGAYDIEENMTVLRAISMAGGFSQFGSASRVKVLKPKKGMTGYDVIKVNIKEVMEGHSNSDTTIDQGDIIVVSEGIFKKELFDE